VNGWREIPARWEKAVVMMPASKLVRTLAAGAWGWNYGTGDERGRDGMLRRG
jgi:hypothetical protein